MTNWAKQLAGAVLAGHRVAPSSSPTPAVPSVSVSPSVMLSPSSTAGTSASLIWFHGPYTTLYGVDWTGKQAKSLNSDNVIQSPDGARLWRHNTITDADGNLLGSVPIDQVMMWADDSRQFCGVTSTAPGSYELEMLRINGPRDRVGVIGVTPGTAQVPALAACSVLARRAVVVGQSSGYTWRVVMMSLSDGSVIYQRSYPNPVTRIVASHDGQYIAEQLPGNANAQPGDPPSAAAEWHSGRPTFRRRRPGVLLGWLTGCRGHRRERER